MSVKLGVITPVQFEREHAKVQGQLNLHTEKQKLDSKIQDLRAENEQLVRGALKQVGEMKIAEAKEDKAAAQAKIATGDAKITAANTSKRDNDRELLIIAFAKMILATVEKLPKDPEMTAIQKSKSISRTILKRYEDQNTPGLFEYSESRKCMKLTTGVATAISETLAKVVCTYPDLSRFQNEIDPQALRKVLADSKITKVTFHQAVKGTPAEQVALEVKKTRQLEIAFV